MHEQATPRGVRKRHEKHSMNYRAEEIGGKKNDLKAKNGL